MFFSEWQNIYIYTHTLTYICIDVYILKECFILPQRYQLNRFCISSIHTSQKLEMTEISRNLRMDKENVYICICIFVYMYMYIYMCMHASIYMHISYVINVCVHIFNYIYICYICIYQSQFQNNQEQIIKLFFLAFLSLLCPLSSSRPQSFKGSSYYCQSMCSMYDLIQIK